VVGVDSFFAVIGFPHADDAASLAASQGFVSFEFVELKVHELLYPHKYC
jgi:hypothetical protein